MGKTYECGVSLEKAQLLEPGLDVRLTVGGEGLGDGGIGHSSVKMCRLLSMESLELVQKGTMVLPAKS